MLLLCILDVRGLGRGNWLMLGQVCLDLRREMGLRSGLGLDWRRKMGLSAWRNLLRCLRKVGE